MMNSTTNFHLDRPLVILPFFNLGLSLFVNALLLVILRQQETIDDNTRLMYRVSTVLQILLSVTWCSWDVATNISYDVNWCEMISNIFPYMTHAVLFAQLFCYCFISICKLLLITRPLRYHIFLSPRRVKFVLFFIILASLIISIPMLPFPSISYNYYAWYCDDFSTTTYANEVVYYIIDIVVLGTLIIALAVNTIINIAILRVICQHKHRLDVAARITEHTDSSPRVRVHRRWHFPGKGVLTVLLLTLTFYICWLPWVVTWGEDFANTMAELNGWLQPLIYIVTTKEAKEIVRSYLSNLKMAITQR